MAVLVACEFSGTVRDAFLARGVPAVSCDLIGSDSAGGTHIKDDVLNWLNGFAGVRWDALIAFPPCTHLAASGARWWPAKKADGRQKQAIDFFISLLHSPIPRVAVENPVGIMGTVYRKADQIVQPWQFGDVFNKKTCLWLKNLSPLTPTEIVEPTHNWGSNSFRGGGRKLSALPSLHWDGHARSRSFNGIAAAMAEQWG